MHKHLPKIYIFIDQYNNKIFENINPNIGVIYRNYNASNRDKELAKIVKACKRNRNQLFVSNDIKLATKFKADGIYIPSFNKTQSFQNLENKTIKILGSAHNQNEIHKKKVQNCETIFLSPIFYVKKSKTFLGAHKFNYLSFTNNKVKILPLGGISKNNIKKLKILATQGFGGIRIFKKKPASKRPVFIKNNFF
tara:strand:+ start:2267 stop:2848 length:582 start_codon:yes stop_codon:yes gene_type:complete